MSLMGTLQMASNTLKVNSIALQVVGQNIANANTKGYIREEIQLAPSLSQKVGGLLLGMGVEVTGITQKIDEFLEERLRGSTSERASAEAQEKAYAELEQLLNALSDTDLSTSMNDFVACISDVLNQPESVSVRNLAVLQGKTLSGEIQHLATKAVEIRDNLNVRVVDMADRINKLTETIRTLNVQIAETEGGDVSNSDAVGLRDQRLNALTELASLIDIKVTEQPSGGLTVYCGGEFLVAEGIQRPVEVVYESRDGMAAATVQLMETQSPLNISAGELYGLIQARDTIVGGFVDDLNEFARTFAYEFNKIFSSGQGLTGYTKVSSEYYIDDVTAALNAAGLPYDVENGSFQIVQQNTDTGITKTTTVRIDLNGQGTETTLNDVLTQLNAISGLSATVDNSGRLSITGTSKDEVFYFANDTSGFLAAMGINTFFTGTSALDLGVSKVLQADPGKFAASTGGIGADTKNAITLADFLDLPLASADGATISEIYDQIAASVTQGSSVATADAEAARVYEETLQAQRASVSGVSLDEEAINMIYFQYAYQASARLITTLQEILDTLLTM